MNEHELHEGLGALLQERTRLADVTPVRQQILATPIEQMPQQRRWLPQVPKWRLQSMFNATKFAVAGAILALFGGFLLAVVLTQPSEDPVPAAVSSASPEPTATPSTQPETTMEVEADGVTTSSDLLPGVELDIEEVSPGVFRVLSNGTHDLRQDVWDVDVAPDGEVWVETFRIDGYSGPGQAVLRDERVLQLGGYGTSFDGGIMSIYQVAERYPARCDAVETDGSCWWNTFSIMFGGGPSDVDVGTTSDQSLIPVLVRVASDGSHQTFTRADLGLPPDAWFGDMWVDVGDDGTVWTAYIDGDNRWAGIAAYDGTAWTLIPYDGFVEPDIGLAFAVAPDGTVWAGQIDDPRRVRPDLTVRSWDGESWSEHGSVPVWPYEEIVVSPDGNVWFDALTFYDGTTLRQIDIPATSSNQQPALRGQALAPDGSIWVAVIDMRTPEELGCERDYPVCPGVTDGLYVITPEAVAVTE